MKKMKYKLCSVFLLLFLGCSVISTITHASDNNATKKITSQDKLLENKYIDDSLKSQVDKNIEKQKLFKNRDGFVKLVRENQSLTSSIISNDKVVLKWNQNLNDVSTSKSKLNNFIVKNSQAMTFKHVKLNDKYEIYSSVIPFTLKTTFDNNKYEDFSKTIQLGKVGINNLTVMGNTITSKYSLYPVNKEIIVGTKKFIKVGAPSEYKVETVESDLKKLNLNVKIINESKPSDYKEFANSGNYVQQVKLITANDINKLKEQNEVVVTIGWVKQSDVEIQKLELEKLKIKAKELLKNTKGLTPFNIKSYNKILDETNTSEKVNQVIDELNDKQNEYKVNLSLASNNSGSISANPVNMNGPKVNNGYFGMPLADMSITQDLHDGLAIDYQPKGCYLHPGCVPSFAIADGIAHVSSGGAYGNAVVIIHQNGTCSRYAHLNSLSVTEGEKISKGDILGMVGTTGNSSGVHLHFEIRNGGGSCFGAMINPHSYGM